tara:strand:- start:183 stop:392 length:210 start_codon:yes stop_codon:yes gene_type:complete
MKKVILLISLCFVLNFSLTKTTYAVDPWIAIEGVGLGLNILKEVGDKVKDRFDKKKEKENNKRISVCLY